MVSKIPLLRLPPQVQISPNLPLTSSTPTVGNAPAVLPIVPHSRRSPTIVPPPTIEDRPKTARRIGMVKNTEPIFTESSPHLNILLLTLPILVYAVACVCGKTDSRRHTTAKSPSPKAVGDGLFAYGGHYRSSQERFRCPCRLLRGNDVDST